jgi:putative redox protein
MDLITITQKKDSIFKAEIRNHAFLSDMSFADGGSDGAPSPAEFLVSSLGMCIGMVINTYCNSHGYEKEGLEVSMTFVLESDPKRIKNITVDITLPENFPADRKKAVQNLIKTCVIYNSLSPKTEMDIEIVN